MVEKDDYDRAWERHVAASRSAGRLDAMRPAIRRAVRATAAILLELGLLLVALGGESLATLDACVADPACLPAAWESALEEFFGILTVGFILSLAGTVQLPIGLRVEPVTRAS